MFNVETKIYLSLYLSSLMLKVILRNLRIGYSVGHLQLKLKKQAVK